MTVVITALMLVEILPENNTVMDMRVLSFSCHAETPLSGFAGVNKCSCVFTDELVWAFYFFLLSSTQRSQTTEVLWVDMNATEQM